MLTFHSKSHALIPIPVNWGHKDKMQLPKIILKKQPPPPPKQKTKNKNRCSDDSCSGAKLEKCVMSLKYTPVTQSILCLVFLMHVETMHHLNYSGQESRGKKKKLQCMILTYLWPWNKVKVIRTWYELLDPKYKILKTSPKQCPQKANGKVFVKSENMSIISLDYVNSKKYWSIHHLLDLPNNPKKFQLRQLRTKFYINADADVTLKYGHGHWKWSEQVKPNE